MHELAGSLIDGLKEMIYAVVPDPDDWITTRRVRERLLPDRDDDHTHEVVRMLLNQLVDDGVVFHEGHSWQRADAEGE